MVVLHYKHKAAVKMFAIVNSFSPDNSAHDNHYHDIHVYSDIENTEDIGLKDIRINVLVFNNDIQMINNKNNSSQSHHSVNNISFNTCDSDMIIH